MWTWAKKFWWILALAGILVYFGARALFREKARTAAVTRQLQREGELHRELRETAHYRVDKRAEIRDEIKATRKDLEERKHELEEQATRDDDLVADYWNRAFGKPRK